MARGDNLLSRSYHLIDFYGAHQDDDKQHEAEEAPGPAHILLDHSQHDDGHEEDGGYFIPDAQLLGGITEYTLHLLAINGLKGKMISIQPDDET